MLTTTTAAERQPSLPNARNAQRDVMSRLSAVFERIERNKYLLYDGTLASADYNKIFELLCRDGAHNYTYSPPRGSDRTHASAPSPLPPPLDDDGIDGGDDVHTVTLGNESLLFRVNDAERTRLYIDRFEAMFDLVTDTPRD